MTGIREPFLSVPGFSFAGMNLGIKDRSLDFGLARCRVPCAAAGIFTRNNFPGAPVLVGREHLAGGRLQAIAVNSKNANVATGTGGLEDSRRICELVGGELGIAPQLVLPSSTGVIGVRLPMERIVAGCRDLAARLGDDREHLESYARAIMTTDTRPKGVSLRVGPAVLTGVAKGAGMIEPNMATMLAYFFTDAGLPPEQLQGMLRRVGDRSFNRVSVDSDTSTSDTVVLMASGEAGPVPPADFERALEEAAVYLAREIARDGEGATRLVELAVEQAPSREAALKIAKSVINSPLVKTAIHGADPNWGRFIMAVGKVFEHPVPLERLSIRFGGPDSRLVISAGNQDGEILRHVSAYIKDNSELRITISLGAGEASELVWGCDMSAEYVRINADYTT